MIWMEFIRTSWPIFVALITLIIVLAKMHSDIQIIKENFWGCDFFPRLAIWPRFEGWRSPPLIISEFWPFAR